MYKNIPICKLCKINYELFKKDICDECKHQPKTKDNFVTKYVEIQKCPNCDNETKFKIERHIFGQTECLECGHKAGHSQFQSMKEVTK